MCKNSITHAEAKQFLKERLSYVYCHNCEGNGNKEHCENCHRKNMNWEISDSCANFLAKKILGIDDV